METAGGEAKVEDEWGAHLLQVQQENVFAQLAVKLYLILQGSLVIKFLVRNADPE